MEKLISDLPRLHPILITILVLVSEKFITITGKKRKKKKEIKMTFSSKNILREKIVFRLSRNNLIFGSIIIKNDLFAI